MSAEASAAPSARELRSLVRDWRRGRAELRFWEVFGDVYVALLSVVMVGSMAGSVVVSLRRLADASCTAQCSEVRGVAPWLVGPALLVLALGAARLLGPVFSPPAANGWPLTSPVDRGRRPSPSLLRALALTGAGAVVCLLAPAVLSGFDLAAAIAYVAVWTAACTASVAAAALSQVRRGPFARWATWLVVLALWLALGLTASGRLILAAPGPRLWLALVPLATLATVVAAISALVAHRALPTMSRRVLAQTEHLSPSLSGALSSLDLGLLYDVLLARRWGKAAEVTPRRGGPTGWWALVHRDALRVVRAPQPWLVLAGFVLLPYSVAAAGSGRATALVVTLCGLLVGPALCSGLRVVSRTSSVVGMLPFRGRDVRTAHLVVPGLGLLAYAAATSGALPSAEPGRAVTSLACGLAALAASARWVTAPPPDYAKPLVSTPAGGVPTGLYGALFRGVDIWAIASVPLLFGGWGVAVSLLVSVATLAYLVSDGPGR